MKSANFTWQEPATEKDWQVLVPGLKELQRSEKLAPLLWQRGIRNVADLASFFTPDITTLHDPFLLYDMERAVERIEAAIMTGEQILIYGDYDADGLTSTTVMKETIELLGGEVETYIPHRFNDGYGPNLQRYEEFIANGISLIITVDNGVAGHEPVNLAQNAGVDVIITDHHELPQELPEAFAIIHPRHPEGSYPFNDLAGVGVAFKLATALLSEVPVEMLDLVAIGTVADLVSLTDENRQLVQLGLQILRQTDRFGLQALAKNANISLMAATEENIGFGLAPRLNALGRMGDANLGVTLLSTFLPEEAETLANQVEIINDDRREVVKEITAEALAMMALKPARNFYILAKEGWHTGVLGIVASQLVEEVQRPVIVLGIDKETQVAKGSGRSIEQVDLFQVLNQVADELLQFGGHQMAAGLSIEARKIENVENELNQFLEEQDLDYQMAGSLTIDESLNASDVDLKLIETVHELAPFGTDNPAPYFLFKEAQVTDLRQIGADKSHLKLQLVGNPDNLDVISFGRGSEMTEFETGSNVAIVGQLSINEWNGRRKPQLQLVDYKISGFQLFDCRREKNFDAYPLSDTLFVFFETAHREWLKDLAIQYELIVAQVADLKSIPATDCQQIVLVDCPIDKKILGTVVHQLASSRVFLHVLSVEETYLNGMPNRDQFARLFKLIKEQPSLDIQFKGDEIATYLQISKNLLKFMLEVFFDLNFVIIDNGIVKRVDNPLKQSLDESIVYQERERKIATEEFLLFSKNDEIKAWLLQWEEKQ